MDPMVNFISLTHKILEFLVQYCLEGLTQKGTVIIPQLIHIYNLHMLELKMCIVGSRTYFIHKNKIPMFRSNICLETEYMFGSLLIQLKFIFSEILIIKT